MAAPALATSIGAHRLFHLRSFAPPKQTTLFFTLNRRQLTCSALPKSALSIKEEGQPETLDYRVFFHDSSGKKVSPWHDIPLRFGDGVFNFVVEIPKETSAKMEVATDEPYTPIKQDTKKGKLRYYPYNINWNYGLLPQTWEDPSFANTEVEGAFGDNDPVDVVEIGAAKAKIGAVLKVKPLGTLAMLDEGELDWKIIAISLDDLRASLVDDVNDVEKHFPGTLTAIRDWFRDYKIPDGKPANTFGLGNKAASKEFALKVINEANEAWAKLVKRSIPAGELSLNQLSTPHAITPKKTEGKTQASASPRNKLDAHQILKYPLSTESAVRNIEENNTFIFVVAKKADKKMIRAAVEELYGIQVKKVNTAIMPDGTKKAFVKLASKLDLNL